MRTSLAVVALAASLAAQHVTITPTVCTDNQMNGYWTTDTGSTVPGQWNDLVITSESLSQGYFGDLGFLLLSAGNIGCGLSLASLGFGPSCAGVPNDIPGPFIADPSQAIAIFVVPAIGSMWCTHNLTLPGSLLPLAGSIDWTAQFVVYQSPQRGECWQATGNAITFSASR